MLTGESIPVPIAIHSSVIGGSLNIDGSLIIQTDKTKSDSVLAQIINIVETSQAKKASVAKLADRVAGYFTTGVIGICFSTILFWGMIGADMYPDVVANTITTNYTLNEAYAGWILGLRLAVDISIAG